MVSQLKIFAVAVAALFMSSNATAQEEIAKITYPKMPDTSAMVESVFGNAARHGALPYRITIRNNSGRDRLWEVTLSEGNSSRKLSTESRFQFLVKNGTEIQEDVTFQFSPAFLSYDYRNLQVTITASGLERSNRNTSSRTNKDFPKLALSKPLAQRSLAKLDDEVQKANSNNQFFGHSFETSYLPTNWIGYTGIDGLLIDSESLASTSTAQRQAIRTWVRFGGNLEIFIINAAGLTDIPKEIKEELKGRRSIALSLGKIRIHSWNGSELEGKLASKRSSLLKDYVQRDEIIESRFNYDWSLQKRFGSKEFKPIFVFILLLLFAILVAPVNLFVFAKKGRRHRLFITTPIISLVACLLLIAAIFLMDGLGGKGLRAVFADLQPGRNEMRLYTTQEQISRTGVMINPGFETEIPYGIDPVNLPTSTYNPFSRSGSQSTRYEITNTSYRGGFFRSRSEQAFAIQAASATRSRIEKSGTEGKTPTLTSSLDTGLSELFYRDDQGNVWKTPENATVASGSAISLEESSNEAFEAWLLVQRDVFDSSLQATIKGLSKEPNRFFAKVTDAAPFALPTHSRIKWDDTEMLLTGTPLEKESLNHSETEPPASTNE